MHRIVPDRPHALLDVAATRALEQAGAGLPAHTLMRRAGLAVARLALALAPHARKTWIACGPGNNGGDGLEAAMHLQQWGRAPIVSWLGDEARAPADALASLARARAAGVRIDSAPPEDWDFAIDALLGIGSRRAPEGALARWIAAMNDTPAPVLAVDVPSGLDADTGHHAGTCVKARWTLSLLGLKPGLFTAQGRDAAGEVWLDDLDMVLDEQAARPSAWLIGPGSAPPRAHASHKGSYGEVAVIGGAPGMGGAALLAASAALHGGAGRVFVGLLDDAAMALDANQPELMFRTAASLDLQAMTVACGCGGGDAVRAVLPRVLSTAESLVLDADGLNAIGGDASLQSLLAARAARQRATVLTPHPLEAARLLGTGTAQVQADRIGSARQLAQRFACVVVLKGSGTVIAAPERIPAINPTGNARLATAGTGDVLAGMIAARLASARPAFEAACEAVYRHGALADAWDPAQPLTASLLARR